MIRGTTTAPDILTGKTAYGKDGKLTGLPSGLSGGTLLVVRKTEPEQSEE